jgi:hypothetical protein
MEPIMSKKQNIQVLPETIKASLEKVGQEQLTKQIEIYLQTIQSNNFDSKTAKSFISSIFTHIRKDASVLENYLPILRELAIKHESIHRVLSKSIMRRGKCPKFARTSIKTIVDESNKIYSNTEIKTYQDLIIFQNTVDSVLGLPYDLSHGTPIPETYMVFESSLRRVIEDLKTFESSSAFIDDIPSSVDELSEEVKNYFNESDERRSSYFLHLAKIYAEKGSENLLRFSLAQYCFSMGRQIQYFNVERTDARPYLHSFLFLYNQMSTKTQRGRTWEFYNALSLYFRTYNIRIDVRRSRIKDIADTFYSSLIRNILPINKSQKRVESLGRCIIEIAIAHPGFIFDLIERVKTRQNAEKTIPILARSLKSPNVFKADPLDSLHLLEQIDEHEIVPALSQQDLSTAGERILIASALLDYTRKSSSSPDLFLNNFAKEASANTQKILAFSLLVSPISPDVSLKTTIKLKANLISLIFGFPEGTDRSYFEERIVELARLFNKFAQSSESNVKVQYGINISETVRRARKSLAEILFGNLKDNVTQFFNGVDGYVTVEQAKLIRDTNLELRLVNDRTLYSPTNTRITVEICNVGHGIAEGLKLHVFPVKGKYNVEDRHRVYLVETLKDKTPIQTEIFIQPTIAENESIDLSVFLEYDTLTKKNKRAELTKDNRTVWLYPETQFVRIEQPYDISDPATAWFYGRQDLLDSMADNLRSGEKHDISMIIYGMKRAGKTSVVKRFINHTLRQRKLETTHLSIYSDLQTNSRTNMIRSDGDFLFLLLNTIAQGLSSQFQRSQFLLEMSAFENEFQQDAFGTFSFLIENILDSIKPCRLLVVLDEFSSLQEAVNDNTLTERMFGFLSNIIQSTNQLSFIFTGTYTLFEMMREHAFDLAKICTPRLVSFLDDVSARKLVEEPTKRDENKPYKGWLEYNPQVVDRIVTVTNCHPFLIQYVCMQLVENMNIRKHNTVNLNNIDEIINNIVTKPVHEMPMLTLWNEFEPPEHKVLSVIASQSRVILNQAEFDEGRDSVRIDEVARIFKKQGEITTLEEIATICSRLIDAELLESSSLGETDSYKITIPLYQMWLKRNKSLTKIFGT